VCRSGVQLINQLLISDGGGSSIYDFSANAYWNVPAAMDLVTSVVSFGLPTQPGAALISMNAQTIGQEVITIDGQKHDCWVVQNSGEGRFGEDSSFSLRAPIWTIWLDKKLGIDLQSTFSARTQAGDLQGQLEIKAVKKSLRFNAAVADSRFSFPVAYRVKPGGAAELQKSDLFIDSNIAGKLSVGTLTNERWDKPLEVAGHPVLLAYAPTWCQPCRQSMPVLGKLFQEFKNEGLVVVQYPAGENQTTLDQFLATSPVAYPMASGLEAEAEGDFKVSGYPTFVMFDSAGKIVANQTGFANQPGYDETALRRMLARANLGRRPDTNPQSSKKAKKKTKKEN
jgi:thiol-disulfide isomerase/thioredoxin